MFIKSMNISGFSRLSRLYKSNLISSTETFRASGPSSGPSSGPPSGPSSCPPSGPPSGPSSCRYSLPRSLPRRPPCIPTPVLPCRSFSSPPRPPPMDLKTVLGVLEKLAPLSLAESWDNVGLLVEPGKQRPISTILLTNDLTADVMDEAEAMTCDLIISYHPPLFRPFKRLVQKDWRQQLAVRAVENGIAVFSPHTSWDSVKGGLNDWLIEAVGRGEVSVLSQAHCSSFQKHRLEFTARNEDELKRILMDMRTKDTTETIQYNVCGTEPEAQRVIMTCSTSDLTHAVQAVLNNSTASKSLSIMQIQQPPAVGCGQGRRVVLDETITTAVALQRVKTHLGLPYLRLAIGDKKTLDSGVKSVAVCAGSGASVLQGVKADLYITGEMSHHEVLEAVSRGTSVILSEHSNSERGFLRVFEERLSAHLPESVSVKLSQVDKDPLQIM